jgi:predicted RNase H-like HicB family nuclease
MNLPIKALIHKEAEGRYWASVPAFPGCITEADTIEELRDNLRDAIEGWFGAKQDMALREAEDEVKAGVEPELGEILDL